MLSLHVLSAACAGKMRSDLSDLLTFLFWDFLDGTHLVTLSIISLVNGRKIKCCLYKDSISCLRWLSLDIMALCTPWIMNADPELTRPTKSSANVEFLWENVHFDHLSVLFNCLFRRCSWDEDLTINVGWEISRHYAMGNGQMSLAVLSL